MTDTESHQIMGWWRLLFKKPSKNHRVASSAKAVPEVAGTPDKPRSIHSLRSLPVLEAIRADSWPNNRKMVYDVLIPDGQAIAGIIPLL